MNRTLLGMTLVAGLLFSGTYAFSQDRDDQYHRDHRDQAYWSNHLFDRIRADIDHVQSEQPIFSGEQFRLAKAKQDLSELQSAAMAGRFDDRNLDEVVGALERVQTEGKLSQRDRDMVMDDIARLREYREHHEHYYPRG